MSKRCLWHVYRINCILCIIKIHIHGVQNSRRVAWKVTTYMPSGTGCSLFIDSNVATKHVLDYLRDGIVKLLQPHIFIRCDLDIIRPQ